MAIERKDHRYYGGPWHEIRTPPITEDSLEEINAWLESEASHGGFDCQPVRFEQPTTLFFENADVAFEFKMRFG